MASPRTPLTIKDSEAAIAPLGCSSSAAASVPGCSSSKVSSTGLGEVKEANGCSSLSIMGTVCHDCCSQFLFDDVLSDVLHLHADEYAVCGSRLMNMGCTLSQNGIGNGSNVQVLRRLRGGAGAYLDIPGQWECKVCHATRCWLTRKRCYRCDAPRDTVPNSPPMGPLGRPPPQSRSSGPPTRSSGLPRHVPPRNKLAMLSSVPLPGAGVGPSLVEMSLEKREKLVNCCRL